MPYDLLSLLLLFTSALLGGGLNAVAGGGTFFTFPSLTFVGIPLLEANATSTVALWPGSLLSAVTLRREWAAYRSRLLGWLTVSLLGGLAGALLLLRLSPDALGKVFPYLLLSATLLFAFRSQLEHRRTQDRQLPGWLKTGCIFVVAIYGGFFGGGIGILFMATFSLLGMRDLHNANALKTLLVTAINGISVATFVASGVIVWPAALIMVGGSIIGGYLGARFARRIPASVLRALVIGIGLFLTVYFFLR